MKNIGIIFSLLFYFTSFAQDKVIRTLISKDSLSYITIFNNDVASYLKYRGSSPITVSQKRTKNSGTFRCGVNYVCEESGYGKYEIKNQLLILKFKEVKRDSIAIEFLETPKDAKLISVIFSPEIELDKTSDFPIMMIVKSEDGVEIDNFTSESKQIKLELPENTLPKTFTINNSQRVVIDKFQNQKVTYLVNHHKEIITLNKGEKKFKLSEFFQEK